MSEAKLTHWFTLSEQKPWVKGVYEVTSKDKEIGFLFWMGINSAMQAFTPKTINKPA